MRTHESDHRPFRSVVRNVTIALELRGLTKSFGNVQVLRGVNLTIEAGHVHGLVGHNGSGKSTLVKCLSGLYKADDDSIVTVNGTTIGNGDAQGADAAGLRFIHQDLGLIPDLSVADNVAMTTGYRTTAGRIRWRQTYRECQALLEDLGYDFDARQPIRQLTLAQQTGVAIARAIAPRSDSETSLIVLDEPTANLDNAEVQHLFEVIRRLQSRGVGGLFISHHLDEVLELAQVVTILRDGEVTQTSPRASIASPDELIRLMLGSTDLADSSYPATADDGAQDEPVLLRAESIGTKTIKNFDLDLRSGEIVGIAGISGSGRDDVVGALFGAVRRSGTVNINDGVLPQLSVSAAIAAGIAMVPAKRRQDAIFPGMTVSQNITTARIPAIGRMLLSARNERSESADWIHVLQIRPFRSDAAIDSLSGGNQQKVVMARWLRTSPRVFLLDEPTQGVDVMSAAVIHAQIRDAARGGAAVVVASSDTDELARVCTRVLVMNDGVITADLPSAELSRDHIDALTVKVQA